MEKKQLLYCGPPGTGKTYQVREAAIKIINPTINDELQNLDILINEENTSIEINFQIINNIFENFFEFNREENLSESIFLNARGYKPGKTCYRNMSALNKFMAVMIEKDISSILRMEWPKGGPPTFAQYSRIITNFDLGTEERCEGNNKRVTLNDDGIRIKEEYKQLINSDSNIDLYKLRKLPEFAEQSILDSIKDTDRHNMSMWKSTIIGALWFIAKNGFIFKYSNPNEVERTSIENNLLKICFGYIANDNEFLDWVTTYLLDLGIVVESEGNNSRYSKIYYLNEKGKSLLRNMKIIKEGIETLESSGENIEIEVNSLGNNKIYIVKDEYVKKRSRIKEIFSRYRDNEENNIDMITLHPSFEYENFIEGISIKTKDGGVEYYNKDGILKNICYKALKNLISKNISNQLENQEITQDKKEQILNSICNWNDCYKTYRLLESTLSWDCCDKFVLIIDEINRGNMAKVFGETITLLETDKRIGAHNEQVIKLPFTNEIFGIPQNVFILATMNTSDKNIANMDIAFRRRFNFIKCEPNLNLIKDLYKFIPSRDDNRNLLYKSVDAINNINKKLERIKFIGSSKLIGHSYLMGRDIYTDENIIDVWIKEIIPLLEEYFLGEYDVIVDVIPEKFIEEETGRIICKDSEDIIELLEALTDEND